MLPTIDILLVGHVCRDEAPDGPRLGGTVAFSALTCQALGLRAGIVTSAPEDMLPLLRPLAGIPVHRLAATQATIFTNVYEQASRRQILSGRAGLLSFESIPPEWRSPAMLHLAPVADEVDAGIAGSIPGAFLGITPQGWMRAWDESGRVSFKPWRIPAVIQKQVAAVVFSLEDVNGDNALAWEIARQCRVAAVTRGAEGCTLFVEGKTSDISAERVAEADPTGAGDIFAAAFFTRLRATGDPLGAARFATFLAGWSVTRPGLEGIPTQEEVTAALHIS